MHWWDITGTADTWGRGVSIVTENMEDQMFTNFRKRWTFTGYMMPGSMSWPHDMLDTVIMTVSVSINIQFVTQIDQYGKIIQSNVSYIFLPSASSAPNTIARDPDAPIQCSRESWRRLKLMSAASTPTLARPSQSATCNGLLSMKRATTSPETHPWPLAQWATALDSSSNWVKVHVSPVAS